MYKRYGFTVLGVWMQVWNQLEHTFTSSVFIVT